jgi:hypothetical protein
MANDSVDAEIAAAGVDVDGTKQKPWAERYWYVIFIIVLFVIAGVLLALGLTGAFTSGPEPTGINPPGAPTNVSAVATGACVEIKFSAPQEDGGGAITSYVAMSEPGGVRSVGNVETQDEVFSLVDGSARWNVDDIVTSSAPEPTFASALFNAGSRFTLLGTTIALRGQPVITNEPLRIRWLNRTVQVGAAGTSVRLSQPESAANALTSLDNTLFVFESGDAPTTTQPLTTATSSTFRIKSADGSGVYLGTGFGTGATTLFYTSQAQASTFTFGDPTIGALVSTQTPPPPRTITYIDVQRTVTIAVPALLTRTLYTFTVAARNSEGNGAFSEQTSNSVVLLAPGAPSGVVAVRATGQTPDGLKDGVRVSFAAPADAGDSPITEYTVRAIVPGVDANTGFAVSAPPEAATVAGNATTAFFRAEEGVAVLDDDGKIVHDANASNPVAGLTSGETYTFAVTATNVRGKGVESSESAPITPTFA